MGPGILFTGLTWKIKYLFPHFLAFLAGLVFFSYLWYIVREQKKGGKSYEEDKKETQSTGVLRF